MPILSESIGPSGRLHMVTSAYRALGNVDLPHCFDQFSYGEVLVTHFEFLVSLKGKDQFQVAAFHAVVQKSVIPYLLKSRGQHMQQKTANELFVAEGDLPTGFSRLPASGRKDGFCFRYGQDPAVGDGNLMCISAKIFNGIAKSVERFLDIRAPVHLVQFIPELVPLIRIPELFTGRGKAQGTILIKGIQQCQIFSPEFITEDIDWDKKLSAGLAYPVVSGKTATRNNAVHMYMIEHFLIPGMQNLNDAGDSTQISTIGGKLQKSLCTASVKQTVKELLIAVDQGIQLMGKRKYHMEIRRVNHLCSPLIHPDLFEYCLTVRTVTVAAGIIMDFCMPTVLADSQIAPGRGRLAAKNGRSRLFLNARLRDSALTKISVRSLKDLLDVRPAL